MTKSRHSAALPRGIATIAQLRTHCQVDRSTGCWHWLGATSVDGSPRIWTWDHERGEKRAMSGPKAVWNIAHQAAPLPGWFVFRRCVVTDCVCPVHLAEARSRAEIGLHIRRNGARKGVNYEGRLANLRKAWAANGITATSDDVVRACRSAPAATTNLALAALYGICHSTVSMIRRGKTRREVGASGPPLPRPTAIEAGQQHRTRGVKLCNVGT